MLDFIQSLTPEKVLYIISLVMWGLFGLTLLVNFIRGFRKSLIHLIVSLIFVAISFALAFPLARILLEIRIQGKTLIDLITQNISELQIESGTVADEYLHAIVSAVIRIPTYYILLFINMIIMRPIFKGIAKKIFKRRADAKPRQSFLSHLSGILFGALTFVLIFMAWLAPAFGVLGIAEEIISHDEIINKVANQNEEQVAETNFSDVKKYIQMFNDTSFNKCVSFVSGKNHTIEVFYLSELSSIRTKNGNIKIKNEMDALIPVTSIFIDVKDAKDVIPLLIQHRTTIIPALKKSELFNVAMPLATEVIHNQIADQNLDWDAVAKINWKKEKNNIIDLIDSGIIFLDEVDFDIDKPKEVLASPNLSTSLGKIGTALGKSALIKDVLLVYGNTYLQKYLDDTLPEGLDSLKKIANLTKINLTGDLKIIGLLANDIYKTGILEGTDHFNVIRSRAELVNIINNAFRFSTIIGNEQDLIEQLLAYTKMDEKLSEIGITFTFEDLNWQREVELLTDTIYCFLELMDREGYTSFEEVDMQKFLVDHISDPLMEQAMDDICESKLMHESILTLLSKALDNANLTSWKSDYYNALLTKEDTISDSELTTEIHKLVDIIREVLVLSEVDFTNISLESLNDATLDQLQSILLLMNESKLIRIDNLTDTLNGFINDSEIEVTLNPITDLNDSGTNQDEWATEIVKLFAIIKKLKNIGSISTDNLKANGAEIGSLINDMKDTYSFGGDAFNNLIGNLIHKMNIIKSDENPNGFIEEEKLANINWSKYDYEVELSILSAFDESKDITEQAAFFDSITGSQLIKDLVDINSIIKQYVGDNKLEAPHHTYILQDYVDITFDDLEGRNWADEKGQLDTLIEALNQSEMNDVKTGLSNLDHNSIAWMFASELLQDMEENGD